MIGDRSACASVKGGVSCDTREGVGKRDVCGGNARTEMAQKVAA